MADVSNGADATASAEKVLLLVDDEENILASLRRLFRRDGYQVLLAQSGQEGLKALESATVGVVVSDQRMPEMSGVDFLRVVKRRFPDTVRIVLSGYTDLKSVTDAINEGAIYKFLTKPWDDEQLRANVREAFERYSMKQDNMRLARQLSHANEELALINAELEQRVEEKARELAQSVQSLRLAQAVLEHLPAAVFGLCDDGCIAVANRGAHRRFAAGGEMLLGERFADVVPPDLSNAVARICAESALGREGDGYVPNLGRVICAPVDFGEYPARGWVVVITQIEPGKGPGAP